MSIPPFDERPPDSPELTAYDERHRVTYLRLLDADDEGADWREAVRIIFGLDPEADPKRARLVHESHLCPRPLDDGNAGYREFLRPPNSRK